MREFYRFPHTPHLLWLGKETPRSDKVLSLPEARAFLAGDVEVEEKVDGANLGLSFDSQGTLQAQNRGSYLDPEQAHAQFKPLFRWLAGRQEAIAEALFPDLMLFGEWCYAVHSIRYNRLPDWFLVFDVYDRSCERFWSTRRRDELAARLGLAIVPKLGQGRFNLDTVRHFPEHSLVTEGRAEGIYVRQEDEDWLLARAKIVNPEFVQQIEEHWSRRSLETNALAKP